MSEPHRPHTRPVWLPIWRRRRLPWRLLVTLLLAVAAGGHIVWHYLPRERAGIPREGDLPGQLLARGRYDARLWLPCPHQNLGRLADSVDDPRAYLAAAARAAEVPEPVLVSFGPFPAPPSREITLAGDLDGQRFAATARVFPLLAGLSRLAGWLAGNPWLAGGDVRLGEYSARVRWQGTLWILESADAPIDIAPETGRGGPPAASSAPPALARLRLSRQAGALPPGSYHLVRVSSGFLLSGSDAEAESPDLAEHPSFTTATAVAFVAGDAPGGEGGSGGDGGDRAAALFGDRIEGLPAAAVFHRPGRERWRLPGEGLLSLLGRDLPEEEVDGWGIVAYDEATLESARDLLGSLDEVRADEGGGPGLVYGLWLAPGPARRTMEGVADLLESVPLLGRRRARPWRDRATLLEPLGRFEHISVEVGRDPGQLRIAFISLPRGP